MVNQVAGQETQSFPGLSDKKKINKDFDLLSENPGKLWGGGLERRNDGICVHVFHQHGAQIGRGQGPAEESKAAAGLMTWYLGQSALLHKVENMNVVRRTRVKRQA